MASIASELAPAVEVEAAPPSGDEEARVRAALVKPRSAAVVYTLAQANQRAQQLAELSPSELQSVLAQSQQQAQADALARGEAIDDEREAALGD